MLSGIMHFFPQTFQIFTSFLRTSTNDFNVGWRRLKAWPISVTRGCCLLHQTSRSYSKVLLKFIRNWSSSMRRTRSDFCCASSAMTSPEVVLVFGACACSRSCRTFDLCSISCSQFTVSSSRRFKSGISNLKNKEKHSWIQPTMGVKTW